VTGARTPPHWSASGKAPDYDLWDLRSLFEDAVRLAVPGGRVVEGKDGWAAASGAGEPAWGWAGPLTADRPAWGAPVFGFELDVDVRARMLTEFRPLPSTPAAERDLALVLPPGVQAAAVEAVMRRVGGPLLEDLRAFDEYRSPDLAGGRSVAWHLVFRAADRTLRDQEVDTAVNAIVRATREELRVELRES
jgi:phenylalanyl-tRNA synthetase beta chain